jgi:nicotinate-nucleotide pyrophosphorylase
LPARSPRRGNRRRARPACCQFVQIEVETLDELRQALAAGAEMILLDNMSLDRCAKRWRLPVAAAMLEASGNVGLDTVRAIAETGVDRISIGGLTKDVRALDLSMRFQGQQAAAVQEKREPAGPCAFRADSVTGTAGKAVI